MASAASEEGMGRSGSPQRSRQEPVPRGVPIVAPVDDDTQHTRLYNMQVMHAAAVLTDAPESTRAFPRTARRGIVAAAVIVLIATIAIPLLNGIGLERYRTGPFHFEAPAAWTVREARAAWSGGSSHAVIGTVPIPSRCGDGNVDINCYFGLRLPPSGVSITLTSGGPFLQADDMADYLAQVRSEGSRMQIGGFEAYRFDREIAPNDYYRSDREASWLVLPDPYVGVGWLIHASVRGPGTDGLMRDVERLVASMRLAP